MRRAMEAIVAELGAADMQAIDTDDTIIVRHLRAALRIAREALQARPSRAPRTMHEIADGIVLDEAREGTSPRWYFSAARIARALQSQGLSPDGAASIVGQMIEQGMRAMPRR